MTLKIIIQLGYSPQHYQTKKIDPHRIYWNGLSYGMVTQQLVQLSENTKNLGVVMWSLHPLPVTVSVI